jgi:multidrug efflux pump subunit AcrB
VTFVAYGRWNFYKMGAILPKRRLQAHENLRPRQHSEAMMSSQGFGSQRISNWVFVLWHYQCWATRAFAVVAVALLLGLGHLLDSHSPWLSLWQSPHWGWWLAVFGVTFGVSAWALDSLKAAGLLFGVTLLVMLITLVGVGLLVPEVSSASFLVSTKASTAAQTHNQPALLAMLAWVVAWMMALSNGLHIIMTWLREMARGLYQHDALVEALKLTIGPVALSNLTTALGFAAAAWVVPALSGMAWVVGLAAAVSVLLYLTLFPWWGMRGQMPFRVGHTADRHGLARLTRWMQNWPWLFRWLGWGLWGVSLFWVVWLFDLLFALTAVWGLLLVSGVLLWGYWQSLRLSLQVVATVAVSLVWILAAVTGWQAWQGTDLGLPLALLFVIPMGMILDDAVHYYSRYRRARQTTLLNTQESCHRYALSSVGRPIWVTSLVLVSGLGVLALTGDSLMVSLALVTISGLVITAYQLLLWQPAQAIARKHSRSSFKEL